jgi:hypothetical protein
VGVHPESGRGVDLADRAAGLATGSAMSGEMKSIRPRRADDRGGLLGDLDVVRVRLEGAVDRDAAGRHVAGEA